MFLFNNDNDGAWLMAKSGTDSSGEINIANGGTVPEMNLSLMDGSKSPYLSDSESHIGQGSSETSHYDTSDRMVTDVSGKAKFVKKAKSYIDTSVYTVVKDSSGNDFQVENEGKKDERITVYFKDNSLENQQAPAFIAFDSDGNVIDSNGIRFKKEPY